CIIRTGTNGRHLIICNNVVPGRGTDCRERPSTRLQNIWVGLTTSMDTDRASTTRASRQLAITIGEVLKLQSIARAVARPLYQLHVVGRGVVEREICCIDDGLIVAI